ncbi:hypothetical protein [Streptomyces cupreus]|uniref:hypothetical protein n=1 Tax=Streptomyces cupreus TaxID=2759956 RepID=UPI001C91B5B2|nr:hypothetical protein [Streptomyces cupreus]
MTTAALGLAAGWPSAEQPVVVECDPAGGDLLGRYRLETAPGLMSLAAAARHRAEPGLVWQHTQRLPGGLPVVVGPAGADQARASLAQLAPSGTGVGVLRRAADRAGTVVMADCGRIDRDSPALQVVHEADVMLLLARARDDALAHVATQWDTAACWSRRPCFVLVGDGYPTGEVARELAVDVMARIPEDPKGAGALGGRPGRRSAPARSPLGRALAQIAELAASRVLDPPGRVLERTTNSAPVRVSSAVRSVRPAIRASHGVSYGDDRTEEDIHSPAVRRSRPTTGGRRTATHPLRPGERSQQPPDADRSAGRAAAPPPATATLGADGATDP